MNASAHRYFGKSLANPPRQGMARRKSSKLNKTSGLIEYEENASCTCRQPELRAFTHQCVISITNRLVMRTDGTPRGWRGVCRFQWFEGRARSLVGALSVAEGVPVSMWCLVVVHPNVTWIVFSNAVRVKGFSKSVMPRFNTSRSAISSPV